MLGLIIISLIIISLIILYSKKLYKIYKKITMPKQNLNWQTCQFYAKNCSLYLQQKAINGNLKNMYIFKNNLYNKNFYN